MRETPTIAQQPVEGPETPITMQLDPANTTPVFGSAQPATGAASALRKQAYSRPAHDPMRWMTLLAADRADAAGEVGREALTPGKQPLVARHIYRQMKAHPEGYAAAGAAVIGVALRRALRRRGKARG